MDFNINEAYDYVNNVLKLNPTVKDGMGKLLDYCRNYQESCAWDIVQSMDFKKDELDIREWILSNLEAEQLCEEVEAFWFGLFDGIIDDEELCVLYFSGVELISDEDEEELDFEEVYIPNDRYSDSKVLHDISIILKNEGGKIAEVGEYVLYLGYTALVVNSIINNLDKKLLIDLRIPSKAMVGFDSGDYVNLEIFGEK